MHVLNPFQALANLCATLEAKQEQDEVLRVKVQKIKELCVTLLKAPLEQAEKTLQRLPILLNPVFANDKITRDLDAFLEHLNEIKSDTESRKKLCANLVSMDDYGLEGDEDEETKNQMRIDAFEATINLAKSDMQSKIPSGSHAAINKILKIQTGHTIGEVEQTTFHINPAEEKKDDFYKRTSQTKPDEEPSKILTKELELYITVCVGAKRPDNLTMQDLYSAIMASYQHFRIKNKLINSDIDSFLGQELQLKQTMVNLIEKKIISFTEASNLLELFNQDNKFKRTTDGYALDLNDDITSQINKLALINKVISLHQAHSLITLTKKNITIVNKATEETNPTHKPTK